MNVLFGEMSIQVFCPFFDWVICCCCCCFFIELHELFRYFGELSFVGCLICKHFLQFQVLSFYLVYGFLCCAKDFKFNQVPFVKICFYFHYSRKWVKKDLAVIYVKVFFLCFSLSILSSLTFRSLIHFEFIFVYGVREYSSFIDLRAAVQLSQHHLLKIQCIFLSLLKIN